MSILKENEVKKCMYCGYNFIIENKYQMACNDCKRKNDDMIDSATYTYEILKERNEMLTKRKTMLFDEDVSIDYDIIEELEKL